MHLYQGDDQNLYYKSILQDATDLQYTNLRCGHSIGKWEVKRMMGLLVVSIAPISKKMKVEEDIPFMARLVGRYKRISVEEVHLV